MSIPKGTHCIITDPSSQKSPVILAETYQADRSLYHGQRSRYARGHTISLTTRRAHSTTIKLANASGGTLRSCPTNTTHAGAQGRATGRSGRFALRTHGTPHGTAHGRTHPTGAHTLPYTRQASASNGRTRASLFARHGTHARAHRCVPTGRKRAHASRALTHTPTHSLRSQ